MSDTDDEKVGYCKPPKKTQFQKGRSGNPSGRPKGARNKVTQADFETMFISEAYRQIEIAENGRPLKMTVIQAAVRRLGLEAARGDRKALQTLLTHVQSIEAKTEANISEAIQTFITYKMDWQTTFIGYDAEGKKRPEPLPHPEEIEMDMATREIIFNGPCDEIEKAKWDAAAEQLIEAREAVEDLKAEIKQKPSKRAALEGLLLEEEERVSFLEGFFPNVATRRRTGFDIREWRKRNMTLHRLKFERRYLEMGKKPPEWWHRE
jgi:hypothetical protein